jgi:uncharacterized membrane protein YhaH (DUF805 family)
VKKQNVKVGRKSLDVPFKGIVYRLSGILILFSALLYLFEPVVASWVMAVSVVVFTVVTVTTPYPGKSLRGRRLFNFQVIACLLMIVSAYLMFKQRNEWPLFMMIGAILLLYAAILMPKVLEGEKEVK